MNRSLIRQPKDRIMQGDTIKFEHNNKDFIWSSLNDSQKQVLLKSIVTVNDDTAALNKN